MYVKSFINQLKIVLIGKLLWNKRNKILQDMLLEKKNYLQGGNSASCWATLHHLTIFL